MKIKRSKIEIKKGNMCVEIWYQNNVAKSSVPIRTSSEADAANWQQPHPPSSPTLASTKEARKAAHFLGFP